MAYAWNCHPMKQCTFSGYNVIIFERSSSFVLVNEWRNLWVPLFQYNGFHLFTKILFLFFIFVKNTWLPALTQYTANQYVCLTTNLENDIKSLLLRLESLHLALRSSRYKARPSAASSKENGSMLTCGTWAGSAYNVKAEPKYFGKVNGFQYKREATA